MKPTEFIINLLNYLKTIWPNDSKLHIVYAYDKTTNFHIIEIDTETDKYRNKTYVDWNIYVYKQFTKLYPYEDILISEPDECDDMSNVIYELNK